MKSTIILGLVMILALVLGACAPATPTSEPTKVVPQDTDTPVVIQTETPAETATAEAPTAEATTAAGVTISTSTSADVSEPFLVDQEGRTLYLFTSDVQNSGTSACTGDCLTNWPPVVVTDMPLAGTGVDGILLGTITRDDGTLQATYNGWPLYYYAGDVTAGDRNGQGMQNSWYLVSATGNAIQP